MSYVLQNVLQKKSEFWPCCVKSSVLRLLGFPRLPQFRFRRLFLTLALLGTALAPQIPFLSLSLFPMLPPSLPPLLLSRLRPHPPSLLLPLLHDSPASLLLSLLLISERSWPSIYFVIYL